MSTADTGAVTTRSHQRTRSRERALAAPVALAAALVLGPNAAATERSVTLREGPYRLADFRSELVNERARSPRVNGSITRMQVALVDRRGKPVPRRIVMLHHVFFRNLSRKRLSAGCAQRGDETFFGTGEENQTLDLPRGYGYPLRRRDRWWIGGMIMSHSSAPRDVYIEYRLGVETAPRRPVRPFWVRASGCGQFASYGIRGGGLPGSLDVRQDRWRVPVSGRIVAAGGHLHTGAHDLRVTQPACGGRLLFHHRPAYGAPVHPVYNARPLLHEVGLIATSAFKSPTGLTVHKGELLDVHGVYDAEHPHPGVMAITHIYLAPGPVGGEPCPPIPADARQTPLPAGAGTIPPWQPIPLWTLDARRRPVLLAEPPGATQELPDRATVALRGNRFWPEKIAIREGDRVRWRFDDATPHNLTFANGPVAVGGQTLSRGATSETQFTVPGRYQLFCYLHPMTMREQVTVVARPG